MTLCNGLRLVFGIILTVHILLTITALKAELNGVEEDWPIPKRPLEYLNVRKERVKKFLLKWDILQINFNYLLSLFVVAISDPCWMLIPGLIVLWGLFLLGSGFMNDRQSSFILPSIMNVCVQVMSIFIVIRFFL